MSLWYLTFICMHTTNTGVRSIPLSYLIYGRGLIYFRIYILFWTIMGKY